MGKYFGTDGVRGLAGRDVTATIAFRIGRYLGQFPNGTKNRILIARDTRISGQMLCASLVAGITASGSSATKLGVSTTPSISYLVTKHNFDFGIMISASHNPYFDNGIKVFNRFGEKLEEDIELAIEKYIDQTNDDLPLATGKDIGSAKEERLLVDDYLDYVASKATADLSKLFVLIDAANGSASHLISGLCSRIGLKADVIFDKPNGTNINDLCGSTHIKNLKKHMLENGYDLGLAFDGDADRLLMVNHHGEVIDGDAMLYLAARDLKRNNALSDNKIVLTVMSNIGVKMALRRAQIDFMEVQVGDKYVQAALKKHHLTLGGEQSGHMIFFDELNTGDGLLSMVKMLNIIAASNQSIESLLSDLKTYPQVLKNITVANKKEVMEHAGLKEVIARIEQELNGTGRILIRPSGTEPLIRIMVEAETSAICSHYVDEVYSFIAEAFVN
jgi:phosphoglucosamine mutase